MAPDKPEHLSPQAPPPARANAAQAGAAASDTATPDAAAAPRRPRLSLFGEILDWLLVPLMLLWPISIVLTYVSAKSLSNPPYDRALAESTQALAEQIRLADGRVTIDLPRPAREILRADDTDTVYFQVLGARGEYVAGDAELPLPDEYEPIVPGQVQFRNDFLHGVELRIAYLHAAPPGFAAADPARQARLPLVQVAETLNKRTELANEVVKGVILPQFIVLPLAVTLIWFGLVRGLVPLAELSQRIGRRKPGDLSAIDAKAVPEEVAPLIRSINQLMQRLDESIQGQQRFVANAAHQLRTPLAGLKTQTELALLALTRAERSGESEAMPPLGRVALDELVRERVREWVPAAMAKRIDLGCDDARERALEIDGDPVLLAELVNNLIDNAIRYTPDGGIINVHVRDSAEAPGARAVLLVEDSGPGIPEHERELVFERFYRVLGSDPDGRNLDGSGLGLAIVREIARKHHARITIGTSILGGAAFTAVFPRTARPG